MKFLKCLLPIAFAVFLSLQSTSCGPARGAPDTVYVTSAILTPDTTYLDSTVVITQINVVIIRIHYIVSSETVTDTIRDTTYVSVIETSETDTTHMLMGVVPAMSVVDILFQPPMHDVYFDVGTFYNAMDARQNLVYYSGGKDDGTFVVVKREG